MREKSKPSVSRNTVKRYRQQGIDVGPRGKPDHAKVAAVHAAKVVAEGERRGHRSVWRKRRERADALKAEIELATIEGRLVDLELIRRALENILINQRTILLGLPAQIGRDIDDPEMRVRVRGIVDRHIREALELLAAYDPEVGK